MAQKVILIIGGTGAQGIPTIKELLKPAVDGSSPYAIRVLTRDPDNYRAQMLRDLGCELVQGILSPHAHNSGIDMLQALSKTLAPLPSPCKVSMERLSTSTVSR